MSTLRLFIGNMASGKTRRLLAEVDTLRRYGNRRVLLFKPQTDTRSGTGKICSREGTEDVAEELPVDQPWLLWDILHSRESADGQPYDVIAMDEVQFFARDSGLFQVVKDILRAGYDVIASGLVFDFRGEPFGSTPDLALLGECTWLMSYCTKCGSRALYPQRLINGAPATYASPQIQVGGDESYEPRCDEHFVLPGRPLPSHARNYK